MALTFTTLTEGGSDTDASSYTTASCDFSSYPNTLILAVIFVYDADGNAFNVGTASGASLTWSSRGAQGYTNQALKVYSAVTGSSPSDDTVTFGSQVTSGTADGAVWQVIAVEGADTTTNDGIVQNLSFSASNRTTSDSLTLVALSAFASSDNVAFGAWGSWDNGGGTLNFTQGSGFTPHDETDQAAGGDTITLFTEYKVNDTTVDASVSAANDRLTGQAMEIAVLADTTAVKDIISQGIIPFAR